MTQRRELANNLASMMQNGDPRRALWLGLIASVSCAACQVYDANLAPRLTNDASIESDGAIMMVPPDAAPSFDARVCVPMPEICNKLDDDCDGMVDEVAAAQRDCESRVVHAMTTCQSGFCLRLSCHAGYFNCDGHPENGCESTCACGSNCGDASGNDSGNDDAGKTSG